MLNESEYKNFRELIQTLEKKLGVLEDNEFSCCGITLAQCHALVEIGRAENISLNELAELNNLENSTMSRTVNNLVVSGIAERDSDMRDRRYVTIALTEKGHTLFESIEAQMDKYFKEIFSHIPEEKGGQVLESLSLVVDAINKSSCCGENNCCK
jgi:DNA-binding MarR family transcriptional regulator